MPDYDTTSLANGVSDGLDAITKQFQNGKIADSIVRVNPEMLQMLGMPKEQFGSLSAQDKTSAITGALTAIGMKTAAAKAQQDAALNQAQIGNLNSESQSRSLASQIQLFMATQSPDRRAMNTFNGDNPPADTSEQPPTANVAPGQPSISPQALAPYMTQAAQPVDYSVPSVTNSVLTRLSPRSPGAPAQMSPQVLRSIGMPANMAAPLTAPQQPAAAAPAPVQPAPSAAPQPNPALLNMNAALRTPGLTAEGGAKIVGLAKERAEASEALMRSAEGTQKTLSDGSVLTSTGTGRPEFKQSLHNVPPGVYNNADGSQTISDGKFSPLRTLTPQEVQNKVLPEKDRSTFMSNATDLSNQLDEWIATVKKYGNNPHNITLPAAALATLRSGPLSMAQAYNKTIDPDVSNQQQKIQADAETFFPTGAFWPASSTTLAQAERMQNLVAGRIRSVAAQVKELPPGLPPSMLAKVGTVPGVATPMSSAATFKTPAEAVAAGAKSGDVVKVYNPGTGKYQSYKIR